MTHHVFRSFFVRLLAMSAFCLSSSALVQAKELCVVPDDHPGGDANCVRLSDLRARLQTTEFRGSDGELRADTLVLFRPGTYRLSRPLLIDKSLVGNGARTLTLAGQKTGDAIFTGSIPLHVDSASGLDRPGVEALHYARVRGHGISLPQAPAQNRFGQTTIPDLELYSAGKRLPRARWPNDGYARISSVRGANEGLQIWLEGRDADSYAGQRNLILDGYFFHDWADESLLARANDNGSFSFPLNPPRYGAKAGQRVRVENAVSDIDMPGEWSLDYTEGLIFVKLPQTTSAQDLEVAVTESALLLKDVANVRVENIGITRFRGHGIVVDGARQVSLTRLEVSNVGGDGIKLTGRDINLEHAVIHDTGGAGVTVHGGSRTSLTPGNIRVASTTIQNVGVLHKTYRPGISLNGVGNIVENNILKDGPHAAILFHGNDHVIADNLIENFVRETDDAGAIYTGQDWTERGTLVEGNVIRSIGGSDKVYGATGIYLDDQASGITVRKNLVVGARRGVLIGGGRDNTIEENIFVRGREGIAFDARGMVGRARYGIESANKRYVDRLDQVPYQSAAYQSKYPELSGILDANPGAPLGNVLAKSIFVDMRAPYVIKTPAREYLNLREGRAVAADTTNWNAVQPEQLTDIYRQLWSAGRPVTEADLTVIP